jgi:radical SAM protein with 4Fe4S-binding SPASM domain
VLKSTEASFPDILALYQRLGLDGGIVVQTLNGMEVYARGYSDALHAETYSGLGRAVVERRLLRQAERAGIERRGEPTLFWTALFAETARPQAGCPWLRHGLYIDRQGRVTTCPHVKDADRHALGRLEEDGLEGILSARRRIQWALETGDIPIPCRGCAIADAVARPVETREASA